MTFRATRHTRALEQQLAEAKATNAALLSGQIDAVALQSVAVTGTVNERRP